MNRRLIVLLAIAIGVCTFTLIGVQVKWIQTMAKAGEEFFSRAVQTALQQVADEIDRQEAAAFSPDGLPVRLFQSRHALLAEKPITQRLSQQQVDSLIRKKLQEQQIFIPFEFAVTDELGAIVLATDGFFDVSPDYAYSIALFPEDPNDIPKHYLNLFLPNRLRQIIHDIRWMFIVSALLTFIITVTFAATLMIIFRQKRLSKIKSDFVHNITHELKTPITTISLAAEMLRDDHVPDSRNNVLRLSQMISSENSRLLHLVEQALQSAVFERGKLKLRTRPVDMHELIQEVLSQFSLQFDALPVVTECHFHAAHALVMADAVHLAHALSNLIDNAIKYRKEREPLRITVRTENKHNLLRIAITDNGVGIDGRSYKTKHLFKQFYRNLSTENVYRIKGFGLGLYYVKNIIETHHGKLFASGSAGEGSTFGFELPVYKVKNNSTNQ